MKPPIVSDTPTTTQSTDSTPPLCASVCPCTTHLPPLSIWPTHLVLLFISHFSIKTWVHDDWPITEPLWIWSICSNFFFKNEQTPNKLRVLSFLLLTQWFLGLVLTHKLKFRKVNYFFTKSISFTLDDPDFTLDSFPHSIFSRQYRSNKSKSVIYRLSRVSGTLISGKVLYIFFHDFV